MDSNILIIDKVHKEYGVVAHRLETAYVQQSYSYSA